MWYQNRRQLQTGQFPLTQRVSSQWPRFNQLRDGQKLPKNRLWLICINTNCENQNDWLDDWSGRKKIKLTKKLKLPARLLVRPWPDQPDRLLRPCAMCSKLSEKKWLDCLQHCSDFNLNVPTSTAVTVCSSKMTSSVSTVKCSRRYGRRYRPTSCYIRPKYQSL